jgi:hypothetical protein
MLGHVLSWTVELVKDSRIAVESLTGVHNELVKYLRVINT